ncbi:MAG: hypothetical protein HYR97_05980 [Candidatus Melainabacteria bacterium]|nr:hypothetical protein [Candidatus Melainabacteria bacterium]MBI3309301.1 hypothetical protein [Candidatus Melainabacteria bacterium]
MNIKSRLERASESKQWIKVYFHDGSGIAGKVVRVGQDYLEIESYGYDDSPELRSYARNLVPLNFIKMFTVDSSNFAEAERMRLKYLSQLEQH